LFLINKKLRNLKSLMNINIEPKIFASKSHLKRYWPENSRKMVYQNAIKHLQTKKMDPK